jgi:hypothetical protein
MIRPGPDMEESKGKLDEQLNEGPEETLEHLESRTWAIFFSLAVLALTISLEAAVLVPVLPVCVVTPANFVHY